MVKYVLFLLSGCAALGQAFTLTDQAFVGNLKPKGSTTGLLTSLVAYWDHGGNTASNISSHGPIQDWRTTNAIAACVYTNDGPGGCTARRSSGTVIDIATANGLANGLLNVPITLNFWCKGDLGGANGAAAFWMGTPASPPWGWYIFTNQTAAYVTPTGVGETLVHAVKNVNLSANSQHMYTLTVTSNTSTLFLDGTWLTNKAVTVSTTLTNNLVAGGDIITINGRLQTGAVNLPNIGSVTMCGIWTNRLLSTNDITTLYNSGNGRRLDQL